MIKFTSCFPMVGGSLRELRLLPPLKLIAMILLKVALSTKNQTKSYFFLYLWYAIWTHENVIDAFYYICVILQTNKLLLIIPLTLSISSILFGSKFKFLVVKFGPNPVMFRLHVHSCLNLLKINKTRLRNLNKTKKHILELRKINTIPLPCPWTTGLLSL